jgi:hypothetical protein
MRFSRRTLVLSLGVVALLIVVASALAGFGDYGLEQQSQLQNKSRPLFGVGQPLAESSTVDLDQAQALANPAGLITVPKGLKVSVVSAGKAAPNIDQMVLWPQPNPQYIIGCNEEGVSQPALQMISLANGDATTTSVQLLTPDVPEGTLPSRQRDPAVIVHRSQAPRIRAASQPARSRRRGARCRWSALRTVARRRERRVAKARGANGCAGLLAGCRG